jgi:phage terminase large subunit-like protein
MTQIEPTPKRGPGRPRKVVRTRGERNIKWIEDHCWIPEGMSMGQKVKLRSWQRAEIIRIYDNPEGTRKAIISFGRKNAKSTLAAFLLLLHLCGPEYKLNSQLYSAAQSRQQASVVFDLAAKMVRMSPDLRDCVIIKDTAKELVCPELGTKYRALSAEVATAYGLSPSFIIHDELGQVKGPRSELYEALETATGAQGDPLSIIISTQAPTDADLLSVLIDDAIIGDDPHVVVSLYTVPLEDDPFLEKNIIKANPAFGDFLNSAEVMAMAESAKRMPSSEAEFRNLILNQRVEASSPFVTRNVWALCNATPKPINQVSVYGGLDLSEVRDLTALVLIGKVEGCWQVHPTFWLPEHELAEKSRKDKVPYNMWKDQGWLAVNPGKSIDYDFVAEYLRACFGRYKIQKIAFDRWNYRHLKPCLLRAGFSEKELEDHFLEFGQGFQSMSPALRQLESEILNTRIAHGDHPVLKMNAANAVVQTDPAGNRKLAKNKSAGRIDGLVALAMAIGAAPSEEINSPKYSIRRL